MTSPAPTRRGFIALVGTTALSGCGAFGLGNEEDPVELDGTELAALGSEPPPSVSDPLPVDVTDSHLDASGARARESLEAVPLPLSATDVPNGAMREQLNREADDACDRLTAASEATAPRDRLGALRDARKHARLVAGAWAYVGGDLTADDVREAANAVEADTGEFREGWRYVGTDPVRALIVHAVVESWTGVARHTASRAGHGREATNAITVGEAAGDVERARAHLTDAQHVGERFRDSLSDAASVRSTLESARETLTATVESRRRELPGRDVEDAGDLVDADVADTVAGRALRDLHWRLPETDSFVSSEDLAGDVIRRFEALVSITAFESLRSRVEDGERFAVESVDGVRELRSAAVSAIEDALADSDDRRLARTALANHDEWLARVDDGLARHGETAEARNIERELAEYVQIEVRSRAVPPACSDVLDALGVE